MSAFIKSTQAVEQGVQRRFDSRAGLSTSRRFRGERAFIEAKELELQFQGYSTSVTAGPVWELEASLSGVDPTNSGGNFDAPVNNWELFPNVIEKDLIESDSTAVSGMSEHDKGLLRDIIDGRVDMEQYRTSSPAFTDLASGDPLNLFYLVRLGVKSKRIYQAVLRHTMTVSASYQIPKSLTGIGEVYSSARLVRAESVPALISGMMQTSAYATKAGGVTTIYKGWLKAFPTVSIAAFGKNQITQEWEWGEWSSKLYTINA